MGANSPRIEYVATSDFLSIGSGRHQKVAGGAWWVTLEPMFDAFYSEDGKCVLLYLFDAARILLPPMTQKQSNRAFQYKDLSGYYCRETDTLVISNGNNVVKSEEMAQGIMSHYDENGEVAKVTFEGAAKILLPYLETWQEPSAEKLAAIEKRIQAGP